MRASLTYRALACIREFHFSDGSAQYKMRQSCNEKTNISLLLVHCGEKFYIFLSVEKSQVYMTNHCWHVEHLKGKLSMEFRIQK